MDKVNILGVNISLLSRQAILEKINEFLSDGRKHQIVTPNAEIILQATGHDEELFYILNKADLSVLDGSGPQLAAFSLGQPIQRYPGADLTKDILNLALKKELRVALLHCRPSISSPADIIESLTEYYPGLEFLIVESGRGEEFDLEELKIFRPRILFSTLGSPWQEKTIFKLLEDLPSASLGIGVGGSFDFLTGKIRRAPKALRVVGLEWLWRLALEPWRLKRIYRAVAVFTWKFLVWRFILPWRYRKNVAALLYKRSANSYEILIVERTGQPGHWQLPQGGVEGQALAVAGSRELREELNTDKFQPVAVFKNLHCYEFGNQSGKYLVTPQKACGYRGQRQSLFIAEFKGADGDIKINFWEHRNWRWVKADNFLEETAAIRRAAYQKFMEKFYEKIAKV